MKYLHCKFINYIGIYNGMGLTEISIDFTKCIHNIVLITGRNGSGKSTIMDHLNPFPDSSTSFISEKTAEKHLERRNSLRKELEDLQDKETKLIQKQAPMEADLSSKKKLIEDEK